jgi:hypothetical protein
VNEVVYDNRKKLGIERWIMMDDCIAHWRHIFGRMLLILYDPGLGVWSFTHIDL